MLSLFESTAATFRLPVRAISAAGSAYCRLSVICINTGLDWLCQVREDEPSTIDHDHNIQDQDNRNDQDYPSHPSIFGSSDKEVETSSIAEFAAEPDHPPKGLDVGPPPFPDDSNGQQQAAITIDDIDAAFASLSPDAFAALGTHHDF